MTTLDKAKELLENNSLVIAYGESVKAYNERGIKTLLSILSESPKLLYGASVADKIVGKAAALLMAKGGVKEVYAETVSEGAVEVFRKFRIPFTYKVLTANIINRAGTGICPMEQTVQRIDEPESAFEALKQTQILLISKEA